MAKKLSAKLRLYYRGQVRRPTRVASENDMQTIGQALRECLPNRSKATFRSHWFDARDNSLKSVRFKIVVGLESALRLLKQKRTKALIFDQSANEHLTKYLIEFAHGIGAPTVQASKLGDLVGGSNFKNLLFVSLIFVDDIDHSKYGKDDPRPQIPEQTIECESFHKLIALFVEDLKQSQTSKSDRSTFVPPLVEFVPSTGVSKQKKQSKAGRAKKKLKRESDEQKQ